MKNQLSDFGVHARLASMDKKSEERFGGPGCACEFCTGEGHCMGNPWLRIVQRNDERNVCPKHSDLPLWYLTSLPVLSCGQADDLVFDNGRTRLWLSRCTVEDGEPFNNKVTVECFVNGPTKTVKDGGGVWEVQREYQAS